MKCWMTPPQGPCSMPPQPIGSLPLPALSHGLAAMKNLLRRFPLKQFVYDNLEDSAFLLLTCAMRATWSLAGAFHVKRKESINCVRPKLSVIVRELGNTPAYASRKRRSRAGVKTTLAQNRAFRDSRSQAGAPVFFYPTKQILEVSDLSAGIAHYRSWISYFCLQGLTICFGLSFA
jgi:hypothetical protein